MILANSVFSINAKSKLGNADKLSFNQSGKLDVSPNHVISRYQDGEVLSRYKDDFWDLKPYSNRSNLNSMTIVFSNLPGNQVYHAKRIFLVLIYFSKSCRGHGLSASTIVSFMKCIRPIAFFADKNQCRILDVLESREMLTRFLRKDHSKNRLLSLSSLIFSLLQIDRNISGCHKLSSVNLDMVKLALTKKPDDNQYPVIPCRLLKRLITDLNELFEVLETVESDFFVLLDKLNADRSYGRSEGKQAQLGLYGKLKKAGFRSAVAEHGLSQVFSKYGIRTLINLSNFMKKVMHATQLQIAIFSGMRRGEIQSLSVDCLKVEAHLGRKIFLLQGYSGKAYKDKKGLKWVTDKSVQFAIRFCRRISEITRSMYPGCSDYWPLFTTPVYIVMDAERAIRAENVPIVSVCSKSCECFDLFDQRNYLIEDDDIAQLKQIEPLRNWNNEPAFEVGKIWRFQFTQLRRSLAYYVIESGLVSLPSLKKQMKHLSRDMTLYYGRSRGLGANSKNISHFSEFLEKISSEVQMVYYFSEVVCSNEPLFGAHGKYVTSCDIQNLEMIRGTRKQIKKQIDRGLLSCSETPLGACTSVKACDKQIALNLSACISCKDAVIKKSKLDRVIERQEKFVFDCERNNFDDFQYRFETKELEVLTNFRKQISGGSESSDRN